MCFTRHNYLCSAGVGRTGTFIALDNLYEQARAEKYIQPLEIVTKMRQQRVNMVQTKVGMNVIMFIIQVNEL